MTPFRTSCVACCCADPRVASSCILQGHLASCMELFFLQAWVEGGIETSLSCEYRLRLLRSASPWSPLLRTVACLCVSRTSRRQKVPLLAHCISASSLRQAERQTRAAGTRVRLSQCLVTIICGCLTGGMRSCATVLRLGQQPLARLLAQRFWPAARWRLRPLCRSSTSCLTGHAWRPLAVLPA